MPNTLFDQERWGGTEGQRVISWTEMVYKKRREIVWRIGRQVEKKNDNAIRLAVTV